MRTPALITAIGCLALITACSGSPTTDSLQNSSTKKLREPFSVQHDMPLRAYTAEEVVEALSHLVDDQGEAPTQVLSHDELVAQSDLFAQDDTGLMAALKPEVSPEECSQYANMSPTLEPGYVMGAAVLGEPAQQRTIAVGVEATGQHEKKAIENQDSLDACKKITLTIAEQSIDMVITEVPVELDADATIAVTATAEFEGNKLNLVTVSGFRGSVFINASAILTSDADSEAEVETLANYATETFAALETQPEQSEVTEVTEVSEPAEPLESPEPSQAAELLEAFESPESPESPESAEPLESFESPELVEGEMPVAAAGRLFLDGVCPKNRAVFAIDDLVTAADGSGQPLDVAAAKQLALEYKAATDTTISLFSEERRWPISVQQDIDALIREYAAQLYYADDMIAQTTPEGFTETYYAGPDQNVASELGRRIRVELGLNLDAFASCGMVR